MIELQPMGMDIEHFESHNETLDGALKWSSYVGGIVRCGRLCDRENSKLPSLLKSIWWLQPFSAGKCYWL